MLFQTRPHASRIRLFRSGWMERTTLTPFPVFIAAWALILAGVAALATMRCGLPALLAGPLAGLVLWTLFEYAAHRWVFHFEPRSAWGRRLIFLLHENHHDDPADPLRSIMPLTASLPLGAIIWALLWLALGSTADAVFLGFAAGYVAYDTVHWACHQRPMRGRLASRLRLHHLRHHHAGQQANYAITAIFLDRLFRSGLTRR